jgi:3-oxoacyl-[acyl-carrier protein] reductase
LLRLGKAEEIASTVAFIIENDFITGTTIAVDGGLVL